MNEFRKCDDKDCEMPATHYMVWTSPQYYCLVHLAGFLAVADAIGYPTPATTVRQLTITEMMNDESEVSDGEDSVHPAGG